MKKNLLLLIALWLSTFAANAFTIDSIGVYSPKMDRHINVSVILPDDVAAGERLPVLYLLHGFGNDEKTWINRTNVEALIDRFKIIAVCPDADNSWYWDSPTDPKSQFETFVARELTPYIDKNYPTIAERGARAITGQSMGGHGAMWIGVRNKDIFGAVGSTSGGVDIRPFPGKWQIDRQLGSYEENPEAWASHTVINELDELKNGELAIIVDCGTSDFFFEVNNNLHTKLNQIGIDHDFIVRPGNHSWEYWDVSIIYQITYFCEYFKSNNNLKLNH